MRFRDLFNRPDEPPDGPAPGSSRPPSELRRRADDLLEAGDEAIRRALSSNSEQFLAANRQEGGQ